MLTTKQQQYLTSLDYEDRQTVVRKLVLDKNPTASEAWLYHATLTKNEESMQLL